MTVTRWYVRNNWWPCKLRGSLLASSIDVALQLARAHYGHEVAVSNRTSTFPFYKIRKLRALEVTA